VKGGRWIAMAGAGLIGTALLAAAVVCLGSGCSTLGYYAQSVGGHLGLMNSARPVSDWLADESTPDPLRERLALTQRVRDYAVRELKLPDNQSYRRYADLGRPAAVWNVVAAPELSLVLKTWCFPVVGCVGYRGYFSRADAEALAAEQRAAGLEVSVYGVPAYSTLGRLNWLGGDPLLSTFIRYPEGELVRLVFHELAHQIAYASDDTTFNESFATALERIGGARWLATQADDRARSDYERYDARRREFRELAMRTRDALEALYRSDAPDDLKRQRKAEIMAGMRAEHAALKAGRWEGFSGYDQWFERANNASLGVLAAYTDLVPQFERLFEREGRDFERFYAEVRRLAILPKDERRATLAR
jgi:predicted aminopeptidase